MRTRIPWPRDSGRLFWAVTVVLLSSFPLWAANGEAAGSQTSQAKEASPGRRPDSLFSTAYVRLAVDDSAALLSSPLRWDKQEWVTAAELTGGIAASALLDNTVKDTAQENRSHPLNSFTHTAQGFGAQYSWLVLGGFELEGVWGHDLKAREVAMDGLTSSIIAAGIITPVLKYSIGRVRPNSATRTFQFKPFSGNQSFPSGHTTQAFAIASVVAAHYPHGWTPALAYGMAALVGYSRIEQNAHFVSDVVAGAVIGTVVGRAVVARHDEPLPKGWTMYPVVSGHAVGFAVNKEF